MENNISSIILSAEPVKRTLQFHEEIYSAVRDRNANVAQDLMLKHIQDIQKALETLNQEIFFRKTGSSVDI
jgi:DNA-binding FadR family transcriptional regulator